MEPPRIPLARFLLGLVLLPAVAAAAVYLVPPDRDMIDDSDAIVLGTVTAVTPTFDENGQIVRDVEIRVDELLKGNLSATVRLREPGGILGDAGRHVSGSPEFYPWEETLVFLERTPEGEWRTYGMELGKFSFVRRANGDVLLIRGASPGEIFGWDFLGARHVERQRLAEGFLEFVRAVIAGGDPMPDYFIDDLPRRTKPTPVPPPTAGGGDAGAEDEGEVASGTMESVTADAHVAPSAYTMGTFRWGTFDQGGTAFYRLSGSQPGYDSAGAARRALAAWTDDPGSIVRLALESGAGGAFVRDGVSSIIFNNTTDVPPGAIGFAQIYSMGTHSYKGETFHTVVEGDVVMKAGLNVSQKLFDEAVTHEVGHTIAIRHSDAGEPSSSNAVMRSVLTGNWGASLAPWDQDAVRHVYTATFEALPAPTGLVATATSTTRVEVSWGTVAGVVQYGVERRAAGGDFVAIATVTGTTYADTSVSSGKSYLYRVVALDGSSPSSPSAPDLATTVIFTDPTITPGATVIRAVHLTQLRTAVNAVRALAGLGAASWTDPNPAGVIVKAVHWTELRNRLNESRAALGLGAIGFTDGALAGLPVQAVHIRQLRNGVQ